MSRAPCLKHARIDTDAVIPHPDSNLPRIVPDFDFDLAARACWKALRSDSPAIR